MLRFILLLVVAILAPPPARAATLDRVNKTKDRIIVVLTQSEMANLEDGQQVVVEVSPPRFVLSGVLTKLNPVKRTVVVVFAAADDRFLRRQQVRFLSAFWNPESSPLMQSYGQYHQYPRSAAEGGFGTFYEGNQQRSSKASVKQYAYGWRLVASGFALLSPGGVGGGGSFEHREASARVSGGGSRVDTSIVANLLRPGIGFELSPGWRLGLRYDYSAFSYASHGSQNSNVTYTFGQPEVGLVHYGADFELGASYTDKDKSTATSIQPRAGGLDLAVRSTMKLPAEFDVFYRNVSTPLAIWGVGAGYIFFERNLNDGGNLRPAATPLQVLRLRGSLETRLDDGDKLDWVVTYDGGKTPGLSTLEQTANELGLTMAYQTTVLDNLLVGGQATVAAGVVTLTDSQVDRRVVGYQASLLAFARWEFDLTPKRRR